MTTPELRACGTSTCIFTSEECTDPIRTGDTQRASANTQRLTSPQRRRHFYIPRFLPTMKIQRRHDSPEREKYEVKRKKKKQTLLAMPIDDEIYPRPTPSRTRYRYKSQTLVLRSSRSIHVEMKQNWARLAPVPQWVPQLLNLTRW